MIPAMEIPLLSPTTILSISLLCIIAYFLHRAALPRPFPGIPYHASSARKILGDLPSFVSHERSTAEIISYFTLESERLNAPFFQLFLYPLGKPILVLTDPRESMDIMMRRSKEFDRSDSMIEVFVGMMPEHHINFKTGDRFKAQRKLVADTMTPGFLHGVAAGHVYAEMEELVKLWKVKAEMAGGKAFDLGEDVGQMALDAIWKVAFGGDIGTLRAQREFLEGIEDWKVHGREKGGAVDLPRAQLPEDFEAIMTVTGSIEVAYRSLFPVQAHWLHRWTGRYRRANNRKNRLIRDRLDDAAERVQGGGDEMIRCATDFIVSRELQAAEKEGRKPQLDSPVIRDELFGFLVGGHETTSTTITWGLKYLADNQTVQSKLKDEIHHAASGTALPDVQTIINAKTPYLDAFIEETLRLALTLVLHTRTTTCDVTILGHSIPKGVDLYFPALGPGYDLPSRDVDKSIPEEDRSSTSQAAQLRSPVPDWDNEDVTLFKPERWLKTDEKGEKVFDPLAGPNRPFGAGVRGCFGRKLAYLQMKIVFFMLVWEFDFPKLAEELSGFDGVDRFTHKPVQCFGAPVYRGQ